MEEYYKSEHEKLRQLVCMHHETIKHLFHMIRKKQDAEIQFWGTLRKYLEEVK